MQVKKLWVLLFSFLVISKSLIGQNQPWQDSTVNNLVHTPGYRTCQLGDLGSAKKYGHGKQNLILIPGLGFDASVFDDFIEANKTFYTMYAVTLAGYGKTAAPPMPPEGTSYGEQTWNHGAVESLAKLIDKEKIQNPVIVGHFVQGTQVALKLAIDHPNKVGGVIVLGGPAKFIAAMGGRVRDFPLDTMILFTDAYTGPKWFKNMKRKFFDDNNFLPEIYSIDSVRGAELWKQPAAAPFPVIIRYSAEYFACDVKAEFEKIKCPVLVLRATFNDKVFQNPINNYVKPQYIDSWNGVSEKNPVFQIKDIQGAAVFVWKDQPKDVYREIKDFLDKIKR